MLRFLSKISFSLLAFVCIAMSAHADSFDEVTQIQSSTYDSFLYRVQVEYPPKAVEEIFGPYECSTWQNLKHLFFMRANCVSDYDLERAHISTLLASHLMNQKGVQRPYASTHRADLESLTLELYNLDVDWMRLQK